MTKHQANLIMSFVKDVKATIEQTKISEELIGEIPEHFQDALLYTLMRDPVTLPTSGIVLDRSTIKTHLLSDAHDPFNRQPLSLDQVLDNVELKMEIEAWLTKARKGL